jgi:hypothetical protein
MATNHNKHTSHLENIVYGAGIGALFVLCVVLSLPPVKPQTATPNSSLVKKFASIHKSLLPNLPSNRTPSVIPAGSATTKIPAASYTALPHAATPQPIVTPAPNSSVSNLKPVSIIPASPPANPTPPSQPVSAPPPSPATTSYTSTNWSGYMANSGNYTNVSGSWKVPTAIGNGSTQTADTAWIGIGGVTSQDLIQIGTENSVGANGVDITSAFYEELPNASITIQSMRVFPGDTMNATISETSPNLWTLAINDLTTGDSFSKVVSYTSTHSSAEWIEEDPSYINHRLVPFDNFGSISFTNTLMTSGNSQTNLNDGNAVPISLIGIGGQVIAVPSALGSDGSSFSVTHS